MRALAIVTMAGGQPDGADVPVMVHGYALIGVVHGPVTGTNYGVYLVSGTAEQIAALDAVESVVASDALDWSAVVSSQTRAVLNALFQQAGWPLIPAGVTYTQVLSGMFPGFLSSNYSIADPEDVWQTRA